MKLGISSWTYTWAVGVPGHSPEHSMTALDLLNRASELEVHLLQVADNLPLDQLSPAELDAFEKRAAELDISIEVGMRGIRPRPPPHLSAAGRTAEIADPADCH